MFCLIHGQIGMLDQFCRVFRVVGVDGDAEADVAMHFLAFQFNSFKVEYELYRRR